MSELETVPLKAHLYSFVMSFSMGAILLDTLPPNHRVKKALAVCVTCADEIKERLDTADETQQAAMIVVSRGHLRAVRDLLMRYPIVTEAAKGRTEWVANARRLLKAVETVGRVGAE